jgi:hypothetical protein
MKTSPAFPVALLSLGLLLPSPRAHSALVVPGANGTDGALEVVANTVIDLSEAVTGAWDADNTANAGKGVYDASKWAVVFKYSSVNVASGAKVTFKNHPSRAPVVWLVNGDVTISGTVSLDGAVGAPPPGLAEPGPGGFRGGTGVYGGVGASAGFGVGGGGLSLGSWWLPGLGGSYGSQAAGGPAPYGNPSLVPLIGGSGGGGTQRDETWVSGGGSGGGALLIASVGYVVVEGAITADGGSLRPNFYAAGGSGGAIRIVADGLAGVGTVRARGGAANNQAGGGTGGAGRIRLERVTNDSSLTIIPDPSVVSLAPGATALIWPPANAPTVRVVSIGGVDAPADPRPHFGAAGPDVALPAAASTAVVVETTNVEEASQVQVRATPRSGGTFTVVNATKDSVVSADPLTLRWIANLPVATGYSAVQVKVVRP